MPTTHDDQAFLNNGGTLGARTAAFDWAGHPLGPVAGWSPSLRTALGIVLGSSFPMFLAWSEELYLFFNDAYQPVLGTRVDQALGKSLDQVWPEVWDTIGPIVRGALAGESFFFESFPVTLERHGYPEQTWFTFSYSPVRDEAGKVLGLICMVVEDTEKVRALARHKQAEERLALSLEASGNIGTWSVDLETGATFVDERFARLFQVDAALASAGTELDRFTSMIHEDDRARVLDAIDTAIRQETLYDTEYRIPQLSGIDAWVNARGKVFADPDTGRRRFAGVAVDISGRKEAERARIESERIAVAASGRAEENSRRLDVLLDAAPVGIVYVDTSGRLLIANASNRAIWGEHLPTAGIDDYAAWQGWWPQGGPGAGQRLGAEEWPMARVLRGEATAGAIVEIEPFGQPGVRKTILIRAAAIRNEHGVVIGAVGANMDISAQVTAEKALQESERKFRTIANVIPQMVWSASADGSNDYLNSRWQAFTGVPIEQLAGDGWRAYIHPDDLAGIDTAWRRSLADGSAFEVEHRMAHHDGQQRWVLNRALPVRDDDGRVTRWMGTLTDVHDQKVSEQELKAAARRKDEFLAMLAHELRNPLAPISNAAQLLTLAPTDPGRVRQSSAVITRQVRHMTDLVDDLLDVSRVTRGLVELERQQVDIKSVVANAVEQARPLIEARRHALDLHMDSAPGWVVGDRTRLVQIVANILNNAAKYTPQGGRIGLTVGVEEGQVRIAIADSGIGISPELLPHVFDLFTQAERTPDRSQGGLGLGLALVHSLVQLHQGHVKAYSKGRDQGSTFTVTLPLAPATLSPGLPDAHAIGRAAPVPGASRSVLVVDDNLDAAQSLAEVLRSLGHVARTAATPTEALASAAGDWPQVFILDIGLPEIDGYQLARRLRELPGAGPALFLALTGYGQAHDRVLSKSAGFDHHFVKPVDLPALAALLARP